MKRQILDRVMGEFDNPIIQNNLRGLWVEAMVAEIIGPDWKHTGKDWASWDFERHDGLRLEIKHSARNQTWGKIVGDPRFSIKPVSGYYVDGVDWVPKRPAARMADIFLFAWHSGEDQREPEQWEFYLVLEKLLPTGQKTIGLNVIRKLAGVTSAWELRDALDVCWGS